MEEQPRTLRELVLTAAVEQGAKIPKDKIVKFVGCVLREMWTKRLPDAVAHCIKEIAKDPSH